MISCPKCKHKLIKVNNSFVCDNKHCFDIARQGYVNLVLSKPSNSGDNPAMVEARTRFLEKNYYQKLKNRMVELVSGCDVLIDLGCGEGDYTKSMAVCVKESYGLDMSKSALKHASRIDKNTQYLLASIFHCPISDHCADRITNIFAPAPIDEIKRMLRNDGLYLRVIPADDHLLELKQFCYEKAYLNEEKTLSDEGLELISCERVEDIITLECAEDLVALFDMTPYSYKSSIEVREKLKQQSNFKTRISFIIQTYRKI